MAAGLTASASASSQTSRSARRVDGAGQMQIGGRRRAARQHERGQRLQLGVHRVDLALEPLDLGSRMRSAFGIGEVAAGPAQIGAEIEQVVLDPGQHRVGLAVGVQAGQADRGVGLVDRAVGGDARRMLGTRVPSPSEVRPWSPPRV